MRHQKIWVKSDIPPKCKLAKHQKEARVAEAMKFLRDFYEPTFLIPPPADSNFNYVVAFSACWHGSYLRFTATYACPGPNAISPSFEQHFARLGYFEGRNCYNLWARRHNDQWIAIADDLTLQGCFDLMRGNPWFHF